MLRRYCLRLKSGRIGAGLAPTMRLLYMLSGKSMTGLVMFKRHIKTTIEIDAPPDRVWSILTDFRSMPRWNPFIKEISGSLVEGAQLDVHIAPPGKAGMRFKPTIISLRPGRELRWLGRLVLPHVFDGEHYFLLEGSGNGRTHLTHGETFSGALVPLLGGVLSSTVKGFVAMNVALKERAEQEVGKNA